MIQWRICWLWSSMSKVTEMRKLPHVQVPYENSISATTGLAPNDVGMSRLPRLSC